MNVGEWLRSLGLGQYEQTFRDNKIDFDVFADLTDRDLDELEVKLGDRRRLLKAIRERSRKQSRSSPGSTGARWLQGAAILRAAGPGRGCPLAGEDQAGCAATC